MQSLDIIYKAVLYCAILSIISCNNREESRTSTSNDLEQIEVAKALENSKPVNASVLGIQSFEYIPLETNENTLTLSKPYMIAIMDEDKLIVKYRKQMALFNKRTGKYISDIGKYGNDPNSFGLVSKSVNNRVNEGFVSAFAKNWKYIQEYHISTGQIVNRFDINNILINYDTLLSPTASNLFDVYVKDEDNIYAFTPNVYGDSPIRVIRYNNKGVLKKAYPQGQSLNDRSRHFTAYADEAIFYEYGRAVMFKERYSDTLFVVNEDRLTPRYLFDLEEKSPPYQEKNDHIFPSKESYLRVNPSYPYVDRTGYVFIESLIENDGFLIFSITFKNELSYGVFNKKTGNVHVSKLPDDNSNGFYNDIDSFIPFRPISIDRENNKLVGFVTAEDVLIWFDRNPELASKLPENLSKLSQIRPEDNPVVMIGKFKNN